MDIQNANSPIPKGNAEKSNWGSESQYHDWKPGLPSRAW
jgi:hypothetical protein